MNDQESMTVSGIRRTLAALGFVLVFLWAAPSAATAGQKIHFYAIGDPGSGTQMQKDVAEAMAAEAQQSHVKSPVDFVVVLGDNFYEAGGTNVKDAQWTQKFELMYDKARLPMPFIAVLGNHDWRGGMPDVEIQYHHAQPGTRWQMDGHW